ncbi:exodeoxyribonuclease 8 [Caudoviricetes sp.]|nr:exodeoxyribonuclease 8 [Caudoviricetes sp.]
MNNQPRLYSRKECRYADLQGVHITQLKELRRSPKHYQHRLAHGRKQTLALEIGNAAHVACLEPERFLTDFALWRSEGDDGKKKVRRGSAWEDFQAANEGKVIIRDEEYEHAIALRDAVRSDDVAMRYLAVGRPEVSLTWTDAHSGVPCVGRLDWETKVDGYPAIVDLKTTRNAGPTFFQRDVARLDYHLQLAFYADGYEAITGKLPRVVIVAVESEAPHDVVTYIVPADVLEIARDQYRQLLEAFRDCSARGEWLGQGGGGELTLRLPAWAVPDDDDTADLGLTGWKDAG